MATDYLTAVGAHAIVVHQAAAAARDRLLEYLQHKGYRTLPAGSLALAQETAQREHVDVVILQPSAAPADLALCSALRRRGAGPAVVVLCEREVAAALAALDEDDRPDAVLVRPAPLPQLLDALERALERHGGRPAGTGLGALAFPRLLLRLAVERQTGRLRVTARGVQTAIFLRAGIPVFAEEGSLGETLGRQLLQSGKITLEQFERAVALITSDVVESEQMRLGEALVTLGVLSSAEVMEALARQVQQKIVACFAWERYHADFSADEEHLVEVTEFPQVLEALIVEGVKSVPLDRLAAALAPHGQRFARLITEGWDARRARLALNAREEAFVAGLTGRRTVAVACDAAQLDRIHAQQVMTALLLLGLVTLHDEAAAAAAGTPVAAGLAGSAPSKAAAVLARPGPAPVEAVVTPAERSALMAFYLRVTGRPDHEVLRVAPGAGAAEVEQAYARMAEELKTLTEGGAEPAVLRQQLEALGGRARLARDRLLKGARTRRPSGAQDSGERQRQLEAEQAYQQAREALTRDDAPAALAAFERATTLHPEATEYALGVAWLKYAAADKAAAPKLGEQAQRLASRLLGQQPNNALVNLTLGHFLRHERKLERAQRHLLLALDQESRWPTIEREMRALERQRRGESEGKRRDKR